MFLVLLVRSKDHHARQRGNATAHPVMILVHAEAPSIFEGSGASLAKKLGLSDSFRHVLTIARNATFEFSKKMIILQKSY
jgi:hypothetical protein